MWPHHSIKDVPLLEMTRILYQHFDYEHDFRDLPKSLKSLTMIFGGSGQTSIIPSNYLPWFPNKLESLCLVNLILRVKSFKVLPVNLKTLRLSASHVLVCNHHLSQLPKTLTELSLPNMPKLSHDFARHLPHSLKSLMMRFQCFDASICSLLPPHLTQLTIGFKTPLQSNYVSKIPRSITKLTLFCTKIDFEALGLFPNVLKLDISDRCDIFNLPCGVCNVPKMKNWRGIQRFIAKPLHPQSTSFKESMLSPAGVT
jgi:hypothetical protein